MTVLPSSFAAAIFDFDETMINLEEQHYIANELLCRAMGSDYTRMPESFRHSSGKRVVDDIAEMRTYFGWKPSLEEVVRVRQQHFDEACAKSDLELLPGVERVVRALHAAGTPLAVTSSAVGSSIDAILRRTGIRDLFAHIVDGSEVVHAKPHPEAYLLTASRLGVDPAQCVVFEDSTVGVRAAKAAGMFCVAVRNPAARIPQDLAPADVIIGSFEELSGF